MGRQVEVMDKWTDAFIENRNCTKAVPLMSVILLAFIFVSKR